MVKLIARKWDALRSSSQFGSYVALTLFINIILAIMSAITGMITARTLGPAGRGELSAIQSIPMLLSVLATFGVADALAYYSARFPDNVGRYFTTALIICLLGCIPFALIGYFGMPTFLSAQSAEVVASARQYLWYLPASVLVGLPTFPLRGRNDLVAWNFIRIFPGVIWLIILLGAVFAHNATPITLTTSYLISFSLLGILSLVILWRRVAGDFSPRYDYAMPMLRYGLPLTLSTLPAALNLRLDQILMAGFLAPQVLGLYLAAVAWSGFSTPLVSAICVPTITRIASASVETQGDLLAQSIRFGVLISIILALTSSLLAPLMVPLLFGKAFELAIPAAIILSIAGGVASLNQLLNSAAMAIGQSKFLLFGECIGLVATFGLLYLLLPKYQIIGAAIASLLSYLLTSVVLIIQILRNQQLSAKNLLCPTKVDVQLVINRLKLNFSANKYVSLLI